MFRIDRNLVNLGYIRSIQLEGEEQSQAGVTGIQINTPAPESYMAQELLKKAEAKAAEIVDKARGEADAIKEMAAQQAEDDRLRAWQTGYTEGSEEGQEIYKREYKEKVLADDVKLKRVLSEFYEERRKAFDGFEDEIVGLALEVVKKIIRPAEETLGGVFQQLIRNALKQIAPEGKIIIRVSPEEYERFFSSGSAVFDLDRGVTVTASILKDGSLGEGDCIIDTDGETVKAGIDTQLKYIRIAFNRANDKDFTV